MNINHTLSEMAKSKFLFLILATAMLTTLNPAAQAVEIQFSSAFNFREVRGGNVPLNFTGGENLLVGISATDPNTGLAPVGAIVKARNTSTNETFVLNPDGPNQFFNFVPFTTGRAAGDWVVELQSNVGSGSALLAAAGTGPGTGPVPLVQNLQATGAGTSRGLTWTTPAGVVNQTANDGNIDRLRVRLRDTSGRLLDLRALGLSPSAVSLNQTSFQFDPALISHNGAYVGQMLVEGFNPFIRSRAYETFVVDDLVGLGGTAVGFDDVFAFRDKRQANSTQFRGGDKLVVGVEVNNHTDTWVHAEQDGNIVQLFQAFEADQQSEFATSMPFDPTLTDPWNIVAFNGSQRTTVDSLAFSAPQALPFVRNISITPDDLTPTVSWELPTGNTVPFNSVQIGLFDDATDDRLSVFGPSGDNLFENLNISATSFKFAPGQLEFGKQYVVRVVLNNNSVTGNLENRSLSFFNFSPIAGTGSDPLFLPNLDENGVFHFDFDVQEAVPIKLDPFVAVGYDYEIGAGNPLFTSVNLPEVGDNLFDLWLFDDTGFPFDSGIELTAGNIFNFADLGVRGGVNYSAGAERFRILGIETAALLDPLDVTAFVTTLTFASTGTFTGTMTPITQFVDPTAAPEPATVVLLGFGLAGIGFSRRRKTPMVA